MTAPAGEPTLALRSLRPNLASAEARYGADSVELGNLLLTVTDVLQLALRAAGPAETLRYVRGGPGGRLDNEQDAGWRWGGTLGGS